MIWSATRATRRFRVGAKHGYTCLFARTAERVDDELFVFVVLTHSSLLGGVCPLEDTFVPLFEPAHDLAVDALRRFSTIQRSAPRDRWGG